MPIYAYKCAECGHAMDVIRKVSDPVLTECPSCGKPALVKQVTAAGFQLKGAGWYVTDFRDSGKKKDDKAKTEQPAEAKTDVKTDVKPDTAADSKTAGKSETKTETKTESGAKPAPAASPPPPPKSGTSNGTS